MTEQELRDMPLHEIIRTMADDIVIRVPGGWIYELWSNDGTVPGSAVFVPDPMAIADVIACALRRGEPIPAQFKAGQDETEF